MNDRATPMFAAGLWALLRQCHDLRRLSLYGCVLPPQLTITDVRFVLSLFSFVCLFVLCVLRVPIMSR